MLYRKKLKYHSLLPLISAALLLGHPAQAAQEQAEPAPPALTMNPQQALAASPAEHWLTIPANDLMILTLPDAADGSKRQAVIQLLPAKMSGGHVRNIRRLASSHWWDGTKIYRVAEDFVTQFGGNPDNKPLPKNLEKVPEHEYFNLALGELRAAEMAALKAASDYANQYQGGQIKALTSMIYENAGAHQVGFSGGWPIGSKMIDGVEKFYPITCRGALSPAHYDPPDTGSGAELSVITGEAARNLDHVYGMVGRVIDGLQYLQNLPLGTAPGGFYADPSQYVTIKSIRLVSELPLAEQPAYEYLASYSPALLQYIEAHGGYGNICTVPVPIRKKAAVTPTP